jgi:hypothetical protein
MTTAWATCVPGISVRQPAQACCSTNRGDLGHDWSKRNRLAGWASWVGFPYMPRVAALRSRAKEKQHDRYSKAGRAVMSTDNAIDGRYATKWTGRDVLSEGSSFSLLKI